MWEILPLVIPPSRYLPRGSTAHILSMFYLVYITIISLTCLKSNHKMHKIKSEKKKTRVYRTPAMCDPPKCSVEQMGIE